MRLNVKHVECFRTVMTVGTVTAAAELLKSSQPAVSRSIQQLEDVVGFRLFDHLRGRLTPTASAHALYDEVKKTFLGLDHITRFASELNTIQSGNISVVCAPVFSDGFIAEVAACFLAVHKFVNLNVDIQNSEIVGEWLGDQRYDVGLAACPLSPPGASSEMFAQPDEVCVLPPAHRLCGKDMIELEDLADQDFIGLEGRHPYRYRLDKIFSDACIERRLVIETSNAASVCSLVLKGAGVGIVNPFTAVEYVDRGLVMRPLAVRLPFATTLLLSKHRPAYSLIDLFVSQIKATRDEYLVRCAQCMRPRETTIGSA